MKKEKRYLNPGDQFGVLTIIEETDAIIRPGSKTRRYLCKCICGNEVKFVVGDITRHKNKHCACNRKKLFNSIVEYKTIDDKKYKKCKTCLEFKEIEDNFFKRKDSKDGFVNNCIECRYKSRNTRERKQRKEDPVFLQKLKTAKEKYYQTEKGKLYRKEKSAFYRKNNPTFRMASSLRARIRYALKVGNNRKVDKTINILGCDIIFLKNYIESKFTEGMSWENYGKDRKGNTWELDHIIPCSSFDLSDPEQQRKCFYYTNLQPLWHFDNSRKSNKLNYEIPERNGIPN